jgi:hypothetical protein
MKAFMLAIPVIVAFGASLAVASEPNTTVAPCCVDSCGATRPLGGCPDDYCRKPMPCVRRLPCGQCDDYCPKPLPRICTLPCGESYEYCRKPWPRLCRPLRAENYSCGQPQAR